MKKRLGAKTGETNVFMRKKTVRTKTGGMSNAAYQRAGTRMPRMRENRSRRPMLPSMSQARRIPAAHGPRSMAGNIIRPANFEIASPRRRCSAATAKAPSQETAKVSTKYVIAGMTNDEILVLGESGSLCRHGSTRYHRE